MKTKIYLVIIFLFAFILNSNAKLKKHNIELINDNTRLKQIQKMQLDIVTLTDKYYTESKDLNNKIKKQIVKTESRQLINTNEVIEKTNEVFKNFGNEGK